MIQIKDYNDYLVTRDGHVFSNKRKRFLTETIDRHGYLYVTITKGDGKSVFKLVHRLVAEAYIPNPNEFPQINHKDCNPFNNDADNLEWCTQLENNLHSIKKGNRPRRYKR